MGAEIREHIETLQEYASECYLVVEFGVQLAPDDGSTIALLRGTREWLYSVELNPVGRYEHVKNLAERLGKRWYLMAADSRQIDIPVDTDFLFIDSEHTPECVKAELDAHAGRVKKFIGFHDTHPCEFGSFPEYADAIKTWMHVHDGQWTLETDRTNCCGLTIYRRI